MLLKWLKAKEFEVSPPSVHNFEQDPEQFHTIFSFTILDLTIWAKLL